LYCGGGRVWYGEPLVFYTGVFVFGGIFKWAPLGICHTRVGDGGLHHTVTDQKKMPHV